MKLWLLRPIEDIKPDPWEPWYDKAFGFVVRAADEASARQLAMSEQGDEGRERGKLSPWINSSQSTCVELSAEGEEEVVMRDFAAA